jgi:hypothetical protein
VQSTGWIGWGFGLSWLVGCVENEGESDNEVEGSKDSTDAAIEASL